LLEAIFEHFVCHYAITNLGYWASHGGEESVAELNANISAWHMNSDILIAESKFVSNGSGSCATTAGGQCLTSTAFPYLNLNIVPIHNLHELYICAIRKARRDFKKWAIAVGFIWRWTFR
jgi:hypothetical protein